MDLLESLLVHEVESVLIRVEELVWTPLDIDDVNLRTCGEGVFEDSAVLKVAEFGLDECRSLAWLLMLENLQLFP